MFHSFGSRFPLRHWWPRAQCDTSWASTPSSSAGLSPSTNAELYKIRVPSVDIVGTVPAISFSLKQSVPKNGWLRTSCVRARVSFHSVLSCFFIVQTPLIQERARSREPCSPASALRLRRQLWRFLPEAAQIRAGPSDRQSEERLPLP